jgi:DNA-binding NarL/FixJ family response regulator
VGAGKAVHRHRCRWRRLVDRGRIRAFGATLEETVNLADLLPHLADTVRRGLGAAWVRVSLRDEQAGSWLTDPRGVAGVPVGTAKLTEELRHADEVVGRIECGPSEDGYDQADRELLATLSGQAAAAIAKVRLAAHLREQVAELARSRALADIRMPPGHHMEGIEAAHDIRREHPGVGVAVLSQHTDEAYALALLHDGPAGLAYLLKDRLGDVEDLIRALREVPQGGSVIDPVVVEGLVARRTRTARSPLAALTTRELDVLREMAQGKTNAGIEQTLHLFSPTVEKHVNSIFGKLGLAQEPVHRVIAFLRHPPE